MSDHSQRIFDLTEPLDDGVTVVEASAGTGKTYSIAHIVARLVVEEGYGVDRLLVVTFTRAATAELRDRVRKRLAEVGRMLREPRLAAGDEVMEAMLHAVGHDRDAAARRVDDALSALDTAPISTIHGFCQRMLRVVALETGANLGGELLGEASALVEEIALDWAANRFYRMPAEEYRVVSTYAKVSESDLVALARVLAADPDRRVEPDSVPLPEEWRAAVRAFAARWAAGRHDLVETSDEVVKRGGHGKRIYTPRKTRDAVALIDVWLAAGGPLDHCFDKRKVATYFTRSRLNEKCEGPATCAMCQHPLVSELQELWEMARLAVSGYRREFALWFPGEFERRKQAQGVQTYHDLLRELARCFDDARGAGVRRAIGAHFDAALIDEFQDTDGLQWRIFREVFGRTGKKLFLVGDPKQAIYGFRGANVQVYLEAKRESDARIATMGRNWRSDQRYVEAMNAVLDRPGLFGDEGIEYVQVEHTQPDRLRFPPGASEDVRAPLQLRFVDSKMFGFDDPADFINGYTAQQDVANRVAADIVELLLQGVEREVDGEVRGLCPGDLAVLVHANAQAAMVQNALLDVGVPSVIGNTGTVFETAEATHLLDLLEAIATSDQGAARRVLASPLFGWNGPQLADAYGTADSPAWNDWIGRRGVWRRLMDEHGVMRAFRAVLDEDGVAQSLLRRKSGQRRLTNVIHLIELLHVVEKTERLGPTGLARWLESQIVSPTDEDDDGRLVRLETDALAVQISTTHKAKGLEYPVVFVPFLMTPANMRSYEKDTLVLEDPDDVTKRLLNVAIWKHTPEKAELAGPRNDELRREAARVLYVAMTRARHQCTVYVGALSKAETSALTVLFHGLPGTDLYESGHDRYLSLGPAELHDDICDRLARPIGRGLVSLRRCGPPEATTWTQANAEAPDLASRRYGRGPFELRWGLASYTALTRDTGDHGGRGAEPTIEDGFEPIGFDADEHLSTQTESEPTGDDEEEVVFAAFPAGVQPGTFVHEVFEEMDFGWLAPFEPGMTNFRELLVDLLPKHGFDAESPWVDESLVPGMVDALQTPLGGPLGAQTLSSIAKACRLDELQFDFAIAGGRSFGRGTSTLTGKHLVNALADRRGDGIVRTDYVNALDALGLAGRGLAGFMTGSIDLVFRADTDHGPKWFIADYKSNLLRDSGSYRCVPSAYQQVALTAAMEEHHYFIQYHLYTVALHRYLGWRLGDRYEYERDFGGAYYLFIRGMTGAGASPGRGVFFDKPPLRTIRALDRAFDNPADMPEVTR